MNQREWLEWRFNGLGGSDAAVIKGLFPFGKTEYMLWEEKVNKIVTEENEAIAHGKKYENDALDWFEKKMQIALWRQIPCVDKEFDWLRATIDGLGDDENCMVEAKVPFNLENHYKIKQSGKVPEIYYPQCQQQMRVKGLSSMKFLSYNYQNPDDSVILNVFLDKEYVQDLIERGASFWRKVVEKEPPELTDYDYISMDHNQEWGQFAQEYKEIKNKIDFFESRKEQIKEQLRSLSKNRPARGHGIEMQRQDWKGYVEYSRIPELKGVNLDSYRKEGFTKWPVRIMKK